MRNIIFTIVFAAICSVSAFAVDYYYTESPNGQILFYSEDDNGICTLQHPRDVNGYTSIVSANYYYTGDIVIPDYINIIGNRAFAHYEYYQYTGWEQEDNESLTSVTIPNSVTKIGSNAFTRCTNLTSITIPSSVTSIGSDAFSSCNGLTSVYYTGDIAGWCGISFEYSFLFQQANPLYHAHNLYVDNELVTDLIIPETVTEIKDNTFVGASCLTSIEIPNSVVTIGRNAFEDCDGLTSVTIPNSVTSIGNEAFSSCSVLTSVIIGNSITSIGNNAFSGNELTTVNFNATNCTTMGSSDDPAFEYCSITTLNIGENVAIIPENAFKGCTPISSIVSAATNPPVIYSSSFDSSLSPMTPVTVPCGTTAEYQRYWYYFRNIQEDCSNISDDYMSELSIFPNPTNNILNISSSETISEIEIVNTLGQVVKRIEVNSDNAVCDVENLPNGFYVVRIYNEDTKSFCQKKFAKE
ncbi:MAG: leucine-rich repeat domain-containing protein [Bacteroidales bacterium]|nr:leucine-rich repeat domain-containing protein [Bacteroidales bacterium]